MVQLFPMTAPRSPEVARESAADHPGHSFPLTGPGSKKNCSNGSRSGPNVPTLLQEPADLTPNPGVNLTPAPRERVFFPPAPDTSDFYGPPGPPNNPGFSGAAP